MRGTCLTENVLYYTRINCDNKTYKQKLYKGISKTTFKKHYIFLLNTCVACNKHGVRKHEPFLITRVP